ncbi:MAG TPA: GNAT family N-acetyltransferase [Anaerolineales bacterium]|nr:GNAT family N-acetyltransferase [Anaerolineales bacterium]
MQLALLRSTSEFQSLADEWNSLLEESASHVPFLRHEYLFAWWQTLGGGEWKNTTGSEPELCLVTGRAPDGSLLGIAPLFFTRNREGEPALMLLGSIEISDYLDLIVAPQDLDTFIPALLDFLVTSPDLPAWSVLDFYNLIETSPTLPSIQSAARTRGWIDQIEKLQHCPAIPLASDWDSYLAGIDKKQRHEIRRKMRRIESPEQAARWYIVSDPARLAGEIESFFDLMAFDPEKKAFLTPEMRTQMRLAYEAGFKAGWLQLAFIEIDGEKAAAYLNFDYDNQIWVYNSGINYDLGALSPGWVLLGYLIQWAIEHGRASFDFMRGDEDYKYRFGGIDRRIQRIILRRPTP